MQALDRRDDANTPDRSEPILTFPGAASLEWIRDLASEWRLKWDRLQYPHGRPGASLLR